MVKRIVKEVPEAMGLGIANEKSASGRLFGDFHELKETVDFHEVDLVEFDAGVPEIGRLGLGPYHAAVQFQGFMRTRDIHLQRHAVVQKKLFPGGNLDPLGRGVAQKDIGAVFMRGIFEFDRKPGGKTFKKAFFAVQILHKRGIHLSP